MTSITPLAVFPAEGTPDWQVLTDDAVWVTNGPKNTVHRLDVKTNTVAAVIPVGKRPCSGLAAGFGSVWVPNCVDKTVSRIDVQTNQVVATIPAAPAASEGGIAASPEGVWLVTDAKGILSKIDPATNTVTAEVEIAPGSAGVTYGEGLVWVTSPEKNILTGVDPKTAKVVYSTEVGPGPRFVTTGAGSAWTLNQGDGTLSRVDAKTGKLAATIELGIPGLGRRTRVRRRARVGHRVHRPDHGGGPGYEYGCEAVVRQRRRLHSRGPRIRFPFESARWKRVADQSGTALARLPTRSSVLQFCL